MTAITKSVTIEPGFTVTGTVNPEFPDDMTVNVDQVDMSQFTEQLGQALTQTDPNALQDRYGDLLGQAITQLDKEFDIEFGIDRTGSDDPLPGVTVNVDDENITVINESDGDWTLLGNAPLADAVIGQSVAKVTSGR